MAELTITEINSVFDALAVRTIRNQCRRFMTRDQRELSLWSQLRWYFWTYPHIPMRCYLARVNGTVVGYGVIRYQQKAFWLSGGLVPQRRGRGIGKELFLNLVAIVRHHGKYPIYLEVLTTNHRARAVYEALGFEAMKVRGKVMTMKLCV